tara:strand:+ start:115 stop:345 length:231 start_codon:yes stop_codon:yes gene_type:complete
MLKTKTMIAKEKAQELFDKMLFCYQGHIDEYTAKQCAIITADELIRVTPWGGDIDNEIEDFSKEFYMKVKQEIEKL